MHRVTKQHIKKLTKLAKVVTVNGVMYDVVVSGVSASMVAATEVFDLARTTRGVEARRYITYGQLHRAPLSADGYSITAHSGEELTFLSLEPIRPDES